MVFACTFATLFLPLAECCSMAKLVAFVTLGEKVLRRVLRSFVAEFVDEETKPNAVVGTYWIVGEHYDRMVFCRRIVFISFSPEGNDLNNFNASCFIILFPFLDGLVVVCSQINGTFCDSVDYNTIPEFVSFQPFVCVAPVDVMQFAQFFDGLEL